MNILIAIESCAAHADRVEEQFRTWVANEEYVARNVTANLSVFTGEILGVPDDYKHLPEKTKAICKWAGEHSFDFIFKVDTDTYVSMERLLAEDFWKYPYSGYVLDSLPVAPYCSGPHYWLSSYAFNILAAADWSKYDAAGHETAEDVMVGTILADNGIFPHHEPRHSLFTPVLPTNDIISQHLTSREGYRPGMMEEAHRNALGLGQKVSHG